MQIFYVKHYLTPTGLSYFNDTWFPAVMNIMSKQSGYISCSHDHELDQGDCVNLTVKFDNEERSVDDSINPIERLVKFVKFDIVKTLSECTEICNLFKFGKSNDR